MPYFCGGDSHVGNTGLYRAVLHGPLTLDCIEQCCMDSCCVDWLVLCNGACSCCVSLWYLFTAPTPV